MTSQVIYTLRGLSPLRDYGPLWRMRMRCGLRRELVVMPPPPADDPPTWLGLPGSRLREG